MKRITALVLSALVLAACGSDDDVTVENAWARATAPGQPSGAVYFDLTVAEDDTLVGASVPASVAPAAEIHEVVMAEMSDDEMTGEMSGEMTGDMGTGDGSMDETEMSEGSGDMGGAMTMRELSDGLTLTGGETVSFEPGSYHVMLPELAAPLEVGDSFDLTLSFAEADDVTVEVEVAETAP